MVTRATDKAMLSPFTVCEIPNGGWRGEEFVGWPRLINYIQNDDFGSTFDEEVGLPET